MAICARAFSDPLLLRPPGAGLLRAVDEMAGPGEGPATDHRNPRGPGLFIHDDDHPGDWIHSATSAYFAFGCPAGSVHTQPVRRANGPATGSAASAVFPARPSVPCHRAIQVRHHFRKQIRRPRIIILEEHRPPPRFVYSARKASRIPSPYMSDRFSTARRVSPSPAKIGPSPVASNRNDTEAREGISGVAS